MTGIELLAVVLGLACVALTVRQHIACWPTGLAMVVLYIAIFYRAKLYSDMILQVVYVFLQIYGWHAWLRGGPNRTRLAVSRLSPRGAMGWAIAGFIGTVALGSTMSRYTDASLPFVDAFATVASLIAQWLMGRKVLESWLVWIVVDIVSIGMYVSKRLNLTAGLYVVFLVLAVQGYLAWRRTPRGPATA
ncbi:MAG TPA: nicotinamide riboside transporter PnuC [Isosphaeraceae bacterium]